MYNSLLYDETTFYQRFTQDLLNCKREVFIECPFITSERTNQFVPIFHKLLDRGVKIYVMTRDPKEHNDEYKLQSEAEITNFEIMGVQVLLCKGNHHRKLAILDREILYEGSLNILSQKHSREIMRRIPDKRTTMEMFNFLKLYKFLV